MLGAVSEKTTSYVRRRRPQFGADFSFRIQNRVLNFKRALYFLPMHEKTQNRQRQQLAQLEDGILPEVGAAHVKGYRFSVGRNEDGSPARFWLGHHRTEAQQRAACFLQIWSDLMSAGDSHWDERSIAAARDLSERKVAIVREWVSDLATSAREYDERAAKYRASVAEMMPETAHPSVGGTSVLAVSRPAEGRTLYEAIDAYLDALSRKRMSQSHRWRAVQVLNTTLKSVRDDCPLKSIDYQWLDSLADHFKKRPLSNKGKMVNRCQISPQTVKTTLQYLRQLFVWIDDATFGEWAAPRNMTKPFRVRPRDLMSPVELRRAGAIEQFDIPTLVQLYCASTEPQRAIMLTAIATAGTQQELAVLEKSEFDLARRELRHFRNKTQVEGRFRLPSELVVLLQSEFARHSDEPLAFYTRAGKPLVHYKDGRLASDSVRQMWDDLKVRAGLPNALPFKFLRKFVADWTTRRGGEALGQVALSHARTSVLAKCYTSNRDFDHFNDLQDEMYQEFRDAGMFSGQASHTVTPIRSPLQQATVSGSRDELVSMFG